MSISKTTELGKITVLNTFFARLIMKSLKQDRFRGKVWPASSKGRRFIGDQKVNLYELAREIKAGPSSEGGGLDLEFSVVIRFGAGIAELTDAISDDIASMIEEKSGSKPHCIKIKIVGIKSRQIVKRDMEVIKKYGTS